MVDLTMDEGELEQRIAREVDEKMDIVPYTRRDKIWNYAIYFLIITNALTLLAILVIWGTLW